MIHKPYHPGSLCMKFEIEVFYELIHRTVPIEIGIVVMHLISSFAAIALAFPLKRVTTAIS